MRRFVSVVGSMSLTAFAGFGLLACSGDDNSVGPSDAGPTDATQPGYDAPFAFDSALPIEGSTGDDSSTGSDAGSDASTLDSGGPFILLSYAPDYTHTQYSTYDLDAGKQIGNLTYGNFGTNQTTGFAPWVINEGGDVVTRMNPAHPWAVDGVWSVAEPKTNDAGASYSDPAAIAETTTEAYVALFNRNTIAVLDTASDAGTPSKTIDLSSLVQAADGDGYVDATGLVYDATRKRVWVVLENIDLFNVSAIGGNYTCAPGLTSTIVAIDTTKDALVSGLTYTLTGISPASIAYDVTGDRLLISSAGCHEPVDAGDDAGPGPLTGRVIEAIALATGDSTLLYDANNQGYPGPLVYVDATHAFVSFGFGAPYAWDPTSTTLGAQLSVVPDAYAWDGKGHFVGPMASYLDDGGLGSIAVVSVDPNDGGITTLGQNPVTNPNASGYFAGVALWPNP